MGDVGCKLLAEANSIQNNKHAGIYTVPQMYTSSKSAEINYRCIYYHYYYYNKVGLSYFTTLRTACVVAKNRKKGSHET